MTHTTADGCRLAVEVEGGPERPAIVLLNSLGTNHRLWDRQMPALTGWRVVRTDMRGHGASDAPAAEYSIERLGRDVLSIMDALAIERAAVAGISIGGMVTLWLAIHAADRVERAVLANTAAHIGSESLWNERLRIARSEGLRPLADAAMGRWFTEAFRQREPDTVAVFHGMITSTPVDGYAGCCAALRDADLRPRASGVRRPVLVITGAHDLSTPAADGRSLADAIPGARLIELDAAHLSNVEQAAAFNDALGGFLRS
jgi:3-oxoadipate enol-lactonase